MQIPTSEIYFYHIPKTAGSSLGAMIRGAYPFAQRIPIWEAKDLVLLPPEQIPGYRCYSGHFFSALEHYVDRPIPTVTLLRDPFEQTVSHLKHAMSFRGGYQGGYLLNALKLRREMFYWNARPGTRAAFRKEISPVFLNNYQVRALGCDMREIKNVAKAGPLVVENFLRCEDIERCFDRAVERLEKMAVVGTVERFKESTGLIFDLIGVPMPKKILFENTAKRTRTPVNYRATGAVSESFAEFVDAETRYDRELYRMACQRLAAGLAKKASPLTPA